MFEALLENCARMGETGSPSEVPDKLAQYVPSEFSFQDLLQGVVESDKSGSVKSLRALQASIKSGHLRENGVDNSDSIIQIANYIAKSILPATSDLDVITRWQDVAFKGEVGLDVLSNMQHGRTIKLDSQVLITLTAYSNTQDPWTSSASAARAQSILRKHFSEDREKTTFITSTILSSFLRPLFFKSRPATVTASGRKAEYVETARYGGSFNDPPEHESKPWKHSQRYAITVFEWAVLNSDQDILSNHWHQYTPALLTLLDEPQTDIKVRAMHIFSAFWDRCPPGKMIDVGLAEVFEQAIFPAVLYLPTLTPEDESIQILNAAYPAIFQIAGLAYPEDKIAEPVKQPDFTQSQRKSLDKIIREGILVGYHHANEHIRLNELFCKKATSIVNGMGVLAVKHLKDLIPMISEIMTEPFGTKYPPTLLAANQLLQAIMRCCWPRISSYHTDIIRIITICYLNVEEEDAYPSGSPSREDFKSALSQTAAMLATILETGGTPWSEIVTPLVEEEPLLKPLLQPTKIRSPAHLT